MMKKMTLVGWVSFSVTQQINELTLHLVGLRCANPTYKEYFHSLVVEGRWNKANWHNRIRSLVVENGAENKHYLHYNKTLQANRATGERSVSTTKTKTRAIVRKGLSTLFKSRIIKVLMGDLAGEAGKKASKVLEQHFTFTTAEMAKNFQDSYSYALVAIGSGLATPENQRGFFNSVFASEIKNEFSTELERDYLTPFSIQQGLADESLATFCQQAVEDCQKMAKLKLFQGEERVFSEAELASFVNTHQADSLTQLLLALVQQQYALSKEMVAYLQFKDLLSHSLLFFLQEKLRQEPRFQATFTSLKQQELLVDVSEVKTQVQSVQATLNQAFSEQRYAEIGELGEKLNRLQQVESITAEHYSEWQAFNRQFAHWSQLMTLRLEQIFLALPYLSQQLDTIESKIDQNSALLQHLMAQLGLSERITPRDELTYCSRTNVQLIDEAQALLGDVPVSSPQYSQIAIGLGSVMSSQGKLEKAIDSLQKAYQQAKNNDQRALSQFNLFQLFIRQQDYEKALTALQVAIRLKPHKYALHNIYTYDLQRILGAGGMGCVFLAKDNFRNEQVVIKCFWEMATGSPNELFKEAFLMAKIAGKYIPQPLSCDFVDTRRQQRGYFVAEYIPDAIDAEAWLEKHGAFDVPTGIAIGYQIARGLELAHKEGIFHLDLKPANILLKRLDNNDIQVKIIDFGLAHVAPSLGQEMVQKSRHGLSSFTQAVVFGTLDYAPPEQQGITRYGAPSSKSDVYSFGKTLYRLLTAESPQTFLPRRLKGELKLFELLCDCVELDPQQRPFMADVMQQLTVCLPPKVVFVEPEMVQIPAGEFMMGCKQGRDDVEGGCWNVEKPVHKVTVPAFSLARYPVTFNEFDAFCQATGFAKPNDEGWGRGDRPVINVSWQDAQQYIAWLAEVSGKAYRLPSEAEWEYAARADSDTAYPWGNQASDEQMNYDENVGKTTPVGNYPANDFGLYDMHGNVWEWVADAWHDDYQDAPSDGRVWETANGSSRVLRGGSWFHHGRSPRSAMRSNLSPDDRGYGIGLRLALG